VADLLTDDELCTIIDLRGRSTGLPMDIWIALSPADLLLVQRYIALNRQAILDHWNETTDDVELARALKPLTQA
jgi:hypothetical protein